MTTNQKSQEPQQDQQSQQAGNPHPDRRAILFAGGGLAVGAAGVGAAWAATGSSAPASGGIPPDDDLMREHGVLKRVLLCYRAMTAQVQAGHPLAAAHVQDAALIIHDFIEGFHEGLEEGYVFPRLRQSGQQVSTVETLLTQHARGRVITQYLLTETKTGAPLSAGTSTKVSGAMQAFVRMYEPHEAREDTVIFPALRQIVPAQEFADLGQHFADLGQQQFGRDEFTAMVARITTIEQALGIYDLNQFTPQVTPYLA
ncbi:MAG TPA: hemerythrin domain-containing protein [Streptosporangiaceae bacterium]|jgi:hemerythrin-like domain-containing protein|nr:hemerythrin domain-containing protein [Streptosporangiaceae bacterium]